LTDPTHTTAGHGISHINAPISTDDLVVNLWEGFEWEEEIIMENIVRVVTLLRRFDDKCLGLA
jgi:hypothetical protein